MLIKEDKAYADKDYNLKDVVCECSWLESKGDKKFPLPKLTLELGSKEAISTDDMFDYVSLIGDASKIQTSQKPNVDAFINFQSQTVSFVANKNIKEGEEITYTLHTSCFDNVTIQ
jgi:SET domain-containing protein